MKQGKFCYYLIESLCQNVTVKAIEVGNMGLVISRPPGLFTWTFKMHKQCNNDERLKWKNQVKSSTEKLAGGLSSLKKLKYVLPQSNPCDVYRALFESHLRYGNIV